VKRLKKKTYSEYEQFYFVTTVHTNSILPNHTSVVNFRFMELTFRLHSLEWLELTPENVQNIQNEFEN
jgi:hypothetical protein